MTTNSIPGSNKLSPEADAIDSTDGTTEKPASISLNGILTGVIVIVIAAAGWWLLQSPSKNIAAAPTGILATAPPAADTRPMNADGAPKSD